MAIWKRDVPSLVQELRPQDPIMQEIKKPQLMFVPVQNYGLKQLYQRLNKAKHAKK